MKTAASFLLGLLATSGGQTASAQSLGELAQKEKEKRALKTQSVLRSGRTVKVYTQNDVKTVMSADDAGVVEGESVKVPAVAADQSAATPETAVPDPQEAQQQLWRTRSDQIRNELAAAEKDMRAMETLGPGLTVPPNALVQARERVASARQRLDQLEDDARRLGIPPGWVR